MKKIFFSLLILFHVINLNAQTESEFGLLPKISLTTKFSPKFSMSNSAETRLFAINPDEPYSGENNFILADLVAVFSAKLFFSGTLNFGYTARFRDGIVYNRIMEQYVFINELSSSKFAHRIAFDQTFAKEKSSEYRFRYRIIWEKPLSGEKIDANEFYLKLGNEYLWSQKDNSGTLEIRIVPLLGFQSAKKNKIELGIDYRLGGIYADSQKNNFWLSLSWYTNLN